MNKSKHPLSKNYNAQKHLAGKRGIEWQFTWDTWLEWWGDDIKDRGPRKGQLCMARFNDIGPYHPDNCYKATTEQNVIDAHNNRPNWKNRKIMTEDGIFDSIDDAAAYYGITTMALWYRRKNHPDKYYLL